ncbi:hypothetical protein QM333_35370, partial [Pseudomonas aeruginosa]
MSLSPWSHSCSAGFTLRGWRSEPSGKPLPWRKCSNG